jgi:hypothetical protein
VEFDTSLWNNAVPEGDQIIIPGSSSPGIVHDDGLLLFGPDGKGVNVKQLQVKGKMINANQFGKQQEEQAALDLSDEEAAMKDVIFSIWKSILMKDIEDDTDFFGSGAGSMDVTRLVEEVKDKCPGIVLINEVISAVRRMLNGSLLRGHNHMPCERPTPGQPIGRPGVSHVSGLFGGFSHYQLVILCFNFVRLIVEFTMRMFTWQRPSTNSSPKLSWSRVEAELKNSLMMQSRCTSTTKRSNSQIKSSSTTSLWMPSLERPKRRSTPWTSLSFAQ